MVEVINGVKNIEKLNIGKELQSAPVVNKGSGLQLTPIINKKRGNIRKENKLLKVLKF